MCSGMLGFRYPDAASNVVDVTSSTKEGGGCDIEHVGRARVPEPRRAGD
jgi:hypothetical protein